MQRRGVSRGGVIRGVGGPCYRVDSGVGWEWVHFVFQSSHCQQREIISSQAQIRRQSTGYKPLTATYTINALSTAFTAPAEVTPPWRVKQKTR